MKLSTPEYFYRIQAEARKDWDHLDSNPRIAGPWWQLFRQVQSPCHVLSELIQNADDAGATWMSARITNNVFQFSHNGEDFNEETLQSLCQFGFSNKRHLHTIGFRGVGFKSVFSLGPQVDILTPTLTFSFNHKRFSEPVWLEGHELSKVTLIRTRIDKDSKAKALKAEFDRWLNSPLPLLFFNNIQRLKIQDSEIRKGIIGPGPVPNSEYLWIANPRRYEVLSIRSELEAFPSEAVDEIREERGSEKFDVPPCAVQIILGEPTDNRLFTVLPTEVQPKVSFSFNGPFIQDPARKEIKHPANSPTNTWLLKRIGQLAGEALIGWLNNNDLDLKEKAQAYKILPQPVESSGSLDDETTRIILDELETDFLNEKPILLGHDGAIVSKGEAIAFPDEVLDTWEPEQTLAIFEPDVTRVFFREVDSESKGILSKWNLLEILNKEDIANRLLNFGTPDPKRPYPLERLIYLWNLVHSLSSDWEFRYRLREFPIVPVAGKGRLLSAEEVLTVGGKEARVTSKDWSFLMELTDIVDREWIRLISINNENNDEENLFESYRYTEISKQKFMNAGELFSKMKLDRKVGLEQVISAVSRKIFQNEDPGESGIRIAHIAAMGGVSIQDHFEFMCRDNKWRTVRNQLIADGNSEIEDIFPEEWIESNVISTIYKSNLSVDGFKAWDAWIHDRLKSKLLSFPMPSKNRELCSSYQVPTICKERGGKAPDRYPLVKGSFYIEDYDWVRSIWSFWNEKAEENDQFWVEVVSNILRNWSKSWEGRIEAKVYQAGTKYSYSLNHGKLDAAWLQKFKSLQCLIDNFECPALPAELCRMTPDTRPLYNIERFVHSDLDKPEFEAILDILGVRSEAKSYEPLIERLRVLSKAENPPITHLVDIYRAIDQVILRMTPEDTVALKDIFLNEFLVFSSQGDWETLENIFQDNPDDIPGVAIIHPEARNLAMWDRLEVIKKPTFEMAINWLKNLPIGETLKRSDKNRASQIIKKAPQTVWKECNAWIDAAGEWSKTCDFKWGVIETKNISDFFYSFKSQIADFTMLSDISFNFCDQVGLKQLESSLELKLESITPIGSSSKPPWIEALGQALTRLKYPDTDSDTDDIKINIEHDRRLASHLKSTVWQQVHTLTMIPYLDGQPVGEKRVCNLAWQDGTIYIVGNAPSHHRELVQEISRHFKTPGAKRAIVDCIDRDPAWISAYIKDHLDLEEGEDIKEEEKIDLQEEMNAADEYDDADSFGNEELETLEDIESEDEDNIEIVIKNKKQGHVTKKDIFIHFMKKEGFDWSDSRDCLVHADGTVILKTEAPFHWAALQSGIKKALYWISRGSFEEGIEVPSDIWNWPVSNETRAYLFLIDNKNTPVKYTLSQLHEEKKSGKIELFPGRYLLRYKNNVV